MADRKLCIDKTLAWEGKGLWEHDPDDAGGETFSGITRVYEPEWPGWKIVDGLKAAQIAPALWKQNAELMGLVDAYYQALFLRLGLQDLESNPIASCVFGGYVNQGPRVIKMFQEAINDAGWICEEDGKMGPATIAVANKAIKTGCGGELAILNSLIVKRARRYVTKSNPKFVAGLLNRLFDGA